ncbi:MAG TPA: hypothetical protein DE042_09060 [Colwellia sp.]|nr:hypothetical protein [Colwellia sp.]
MDSCFSSPVTLIIINSRSISVLMILSLVCFFIAYQRQVDINFIVILYSNISFLTLLAVISFLKLIASPNASLIQLMMQE